MFWKNLRSPNRKLDSQLRDAGSVSGEPIRLIIWDLDETFWQGTLTEGGVTYRQDTHDTVIELARRGILSAICSKNDMEPVREILTARGIWDYFVFPSIDWTAKGPRLRALVEAVQLRPESIAFIDDNPLNRAEAEHFVPGLRAFSEQIIPTLLDNPLLRGKPDPEFKRLRQYRLLQERQTALVQTGDTEAFLHDSNIRVSIDYDVAANLDRAIELINRTNQLNFTKRRLPEDTESARDALREQLKSMYMKAGLVSVQDRYGDYGVCGLYMMQHRHGHQPRLVQFCFSCRILNMGVETWLYGLLGRPALDVAGPVLTDVVGDLREITWINKAQAGAASGDNAHLDYVLLRGGCDIHVIAHYFGNDTSRVVRELHEVRGGLEPSVSHSIMARHAINGASAELRAAAVPFGFRDADFTSIAAGPPAGETGSAAWVLSFIHDNQTMLYRFKPTGELLPVRFYKSPDLTRSYIGREPQEVGASREALDHLEAHFEFVGPISDELFVDNLELLFRCAPVGVRVFVLLGNELAANRQNEAVPNPNMIKRNRLISQAATSFGNVETVSLPQCLGPDMPVILGNHYERDIYFRIYRYIRGRLYQQPKPN